MAHAENINIRQNWVDEQIIYYAKELGTKEDEAFSLFVAGLILETAPGDIEAEDLVDGGSDKQIDVIHIEDNSDKGHADITIIQSKNTKGFSSNVVTLMKNGLDWIFEHPKKEVSTIKNDLFKNKIEEIRELRISYGASNLSVSLYHVTNGDKSSLSQEYLQESKTLEQKYSSLGFDSFLFDQLGAHEIIELLNEGDRAKKKIDLSFPIIYDTNRASIMEFSQGDTKSFVCTVSGKTIADITSEPPRDAIFDFITVHFYE